MKQQYGKLLLLGATSLLLTACGGGGGGGSSTPTATSVGYTGSTTAVTISDQTSADSIAGATISSATSTDLSGAIPLAKPGGSTSTSNNSITDLAKQLVGRSLGLAGNNTALAGMTQTYTYQCAITGSYTVNVTDADGDPNTAVAGDSASFTFNSCDDGYGYIETGGFSAVILNYTDSSNMSARLTISHYRMSSTTSTDYALMNGGLTMTESYNSGTYIDRVSITGDALLYDVSVNGSSYSQALTQFSLVNSYDQYNGTTTVDNDYTFYSTAIGGFIQVETTTPFVTASGAYYPYQGVVVITGANNAKVRLTAQSDATNVYIEYDINPIDGVYEANQTVTWSYLESL